MGYFTYLKDSDNVFKGAGALTTASYETYYPPENAVVLPLSKPVRLKSDWTSQANGYHHILWLNLDAPFPVGMIAICGHNFTPAADVRILAGNTPKPGFTAPFQQSFVWRERTLFLLFDTPLLYRYWGIGYYNGESPEAVTQIGYVIGGVPTTLSFNFQQGWQHTEEFMNTRAMTQWGRKFVYKGYETVRGRVGFDPLKPDQAETLRNLVDSLDGDVTPMFWIPDKDVNEGWFGRCISDVREVRGRRISTTAFEFQEDSVGKSIMTQAPLVYNAGDNVTLLGGVFSRVDTIGAFEKRVDLNVYERPHLIRDKHYPQGTIAASGRTTHRTTLIERRTTNLYLWSENLTQTVWNKQDVTIGSDIGGPPRFYNEGATYIVNADQVIEGSANTVHYVYGYASPLPPDNKSIVFSFFVYPGTRTWCMFLMHDKGATFRRVWVDLSTGALGTVEAGLTARVYQYSGLWRRVVVVANTASGGSNVAFAVGPAPSNGVESYQGNGTGFIYVWGLMGECDDTVALNDASSYLPSTSTGFTRLTDQLYFPQDAEMPPQTIYLAFIERGSFQAFGPAIFYIGNATETGPRLWVDYEPAGNYRVVRTNGFGAFSVSNTTVMTHLNDLVEMRIVFNEIGGVEMNISVNGAAEVGTAAGAAMGMEVGGWPDRRIYTGRPRGAWSAADAFAQENVAYKTIRVMRGRQTLATMRAL